MEVYIPVRGLISSEKDVTLEISLKLGEAIKNAFQIPKLFSTAQQMPVQTMLIIFTNDLHGRAQIANQAKGDLFISIHCNATRQPAGGYMKNG